MDIIEKLIILFVYVAPYALIPLTFKFAGGMFATLAGVAQDKSRGVFDRQKQTRVQKWDGFKKGEASGIARPLRGMGERVGVGAKGRYGLGKRGRAAIATNRRNAAAEAMGDKGLEQLGLSDDDAIAVMAGSRGTARGAKLASRELADSWVASGKYTRAQADEKADRAYNMVMAQGVDRNKARAGMAHMMKNKARALPSGNAGEQLIAKWTTGLEGTNAAAANEAWQGMRYFASESGQQQFGSTTSLNDVLKSENDLAAQDKITIDGFDRAGAQKVAMGKDSSVQAIGKALNNQLERAKKSSDPNDAIEAMSKLTALRNSIGQHTPEANKKEIFTALESAGIDMSSQMSVDEQFGQIWASSQKPRDAQHAQMLATQATEALRNRTGLYDQGTRGMDPSNPNQRPQGPNQS